MRSILTLAGVGWFAVIHTPQAEKHAAKQPIHPFHNWAQKKCPIFPLFSITKNELTVVGYKEKDWHIPRLLKELERLGLQVDYFDFDTQDSKQLLGYDVIEINGGNPFYLLKSMRASNCTAVLDTLAREKVVIGISAGSIVLQKNINLVASYSPEMNDGIGLVDCSGIGLVDIEILPHYSRFLSRFEKFEERAKEYELMNNCEVIRLDDGQGVIVNSNGHCIVGSKSKE